MVLSCMRGAAMRWTLLQTLCAVSLTPSAWAEDAAREKTSSPAATVAQPTEALPSVTVSAKAIVDNASYTPIEGYRAEESSALGIDLPLKETPAAISVISKDFLDDTGARKLNDIINYVPGVTTAENGGTPNDSFIIRGFAAGNTYLNGLPQLITSQQRRALDNIERIEIAKGPAGTEAGPADPGGTINIITKKPQREFYSSLFAGLGDYGFRKLSGDVTGGIALDGNLQGRLIAAYEEGAEWRPGRPDHTPYATFAPSLKWEYAPGSSLLLEYQYTYSNEPLDRGLIFIKGAGFHDDFAPRDWSVHQSTDSMKIRTHRFDVELNHRLNDIFSFRLRAQDYDQKISSNSFRNGDTEGSFLFGPDGLTWNGVGQDIAILYDDTNSKVDSRTYLASVTAKFNVATTSHILLAGYTHNENDDVFGGGAAPIVSNTVNLFNPSNNQRPNFIGADPPFGDFTRGSKIDSMFGKWLGEWSPRFRTVIGLRHDHAEYYTRELAVDSSDPPVFDDGYDDDLLSYRIGASYDLTQRVTAFVGYSDAYQPQGGFTRNGGRIEALRARSFEVGAKTALGGGRVLVVEEVADEREQERRREGRGGDHVHGVDPDLAGLDRVEDVDQRGQIERVAEHLAVGLEHDRERRVARGHLEQLGRALTLLPER